MQLETLFKRTKTGAIQYYKVWTDTVDSAGNQFSVIFKESGQLGTKNPVIHKEEVHEGKNLGKSNATTAKEQAEFQSQSDWKSKKDEGYKTLQDLSETIVLDDKYLDMDKVREYLEKWLPKFNTDAAGNVKPMLAKDYNKVKNITYPCYIQPKLDGVRCLIIMNDDGDIAFLSRSGKPYTTLDHIKSDLEKYYNSGAEFSILDGEIYSDELSFQEITSAVKKQSADSLKLHFRAYDIVNTQLQSERWSTVVALVDAIQSPYIWPVNTLTIHDGDDIKDQHDEWVKQGYEGAMLRLFDGHYGQGQRSSHLLKVKEFQEEEFDFLRWELGQREEDLLAICSMPDGREIKAKMIGTRDQKKVLQQRISGRITVKYFGLTTDGLLRFPIAKSFRDYE